MFLHGLVVYDYRKEKVMCDMYTFSFIIQNIVQFVGEALSWRPFSVLLP